MIAAVLLVRIAVGALYSLEPKAENFCHQTLIEKVARKWKRYYTVHTYFVELEIEW
jgi:hypothetical protein